MVPEPGPAGGAVARSAPSLFVTRARRATGRVLLTLAKSVAIFVPVFFVATFVTFTLQSRPALAS
jgi:peptide/nickel transport system permease protein